MDYLKLGFGSVKYMNMIREFTFRHLRSIVFDQMLPEVLIIGQRRGLELFKDLPIKDVEIEWVNEMSWAISGKKLIYFVYFYSRSKAIKINEIYWNKIN